MKKYIKKFVILILFLFAAIIAVMAVMELFLKENSCIEAGICKEGTEINNCYPDGKPCIISKEVCEKIHKKWDSDKKNCYLR